MDHQCLRKASLILLFSITLGFVATTATAAPMENGARHLTPHEVSWWTELIQSLWDSILSMAGSAPETESTNNTPEPSDGDPNLQGGLDPLG